MGRNVYTSSVASHAVWGLHSQTLIIMIHHGDQSVYKTMQFAYTQSSTNCTQEKRSWRFFSLHSPFLRRINANFPKSYIQTRAIMVTMCGHSTLGIVPCTALVHASFVPTGKEGSSYISGKSKIQKPNNSAIEKSTPACNKKLKPLDLTSDRTIHKKKNEAHLLQCCRNSLLHGIFCRPNSKSWKTGWWRLHLPGSRI